MVIVPAGEFTMGSLSNEPERYNDEDQRQVTIAKPIAVGRFAVTRGEFAAFVMKTGHKTDAPAALDRVGRGEETGCPGRTRKLRFK
jgi:formylglycine-generating enzyme required for sulfatase activity